MMVYRAEATITWTDSLLRVFVGYCIALCVNLSSFNGLTQFRQCNCLETMECRHGVALYEHARRSSRVQVVVVAVFHGRSVSSNRYLDRALPAIVRGPAREDNDGSDRSGEEQFWSLLLFLLCASLFNRFFQILFFSPSGHPTQHMIYYVLLREDELLVQVLLCGMYC